MNKNIFWAPLVLFALTLTACASVAKTIGFASSGSSSTVELPAQTKLILGTIKLEETNYAITAEQAKELLPMWYVLKNLNESDTAAQEEIEGLTNQIQETMTSDQVNAIAGMNLTRRDMVSLMRNNGGGTNSAQTGSTTSASGGGGGGFPSGGGFPGGGPDGGFSSGGTSNGTRSSSSNTSTSQVTKTPSALFDAVIKLLEKKLQ